MDEIEIEMEDVYVEENKSNDLSQQKQQAKDTTANGKGSTSYNQTMSWIRINQQNQDHRNN